MRPRFWTGLNIAERAPTISVTVADPVATGLTKTAVACSATPGQCVAAPTIPQLEGGFALPLLAKQILLLAKSYGIEQGDEIRIGLQLAQEDLAQLLGASRQRVNQELKAMERENAIRIEPGGLVVRNRPALMRICDAEI